MMFKEHSTEVVKSNEVLGMTVINHEKEKIGKIEEIVIDKIDGQVVYVVLLFDDILGMGGKYFAVPWKAISYSVEEKSFVLGADKERLKSAPGFDKNNWPNVSDPMWGKMIYDYYESF